MIRAIPILLIGVPLTLAPVAAHAQTFESGPYIGASIVF